ncbi:hypothetical protein PRUPE_7G146300 [Prunus persica]|uniref:SCP domain-containing protein n=1 Tax=Prunus persica TaxID=3760 RepID=A0A251NBJ3_PRUPE|nr:hypothetical protein PRUPE_7G146300 [Prunus persica]
MGACASTPTRTRNGSRGGPAGSDMIRRAPSSIVIHVDGRMQELKLPTQAKHITSQNPNHFLCNSETMSVGTCVPNVPEEEELQPGQIYFLLPLCEAQKPLSLPDLCALAIKAASALGKDATEYLKAHNQARAAVGVEPLKWSEFLANATSRLVRYQRDNKACNFANLTSGSKYGGNQLWASGQSVTPTMVVDTWLKEKDFYNHTGNSCVPNHSCGVYTQVVWKKSLELGCAQATCVKDQSSLSICFYNPPGNVIGESPY